MIERKKGITLISLIVTIIVLIILAGISISALSGDNNIIKKAGQAADEAKLAEYRDEITLLSVESLDKNENNYLEELKQVMDDTGKYDTTVLGDTLVIITKKDNYVFEIDEEGEAQFKGIRINTTNAEPIMMKRDDNQAFWKEEYRTNISRVEIKNYITTSPKVIKEWDVSKNKNQSVMSWIESDGNDGYILYIAANGKIKMTNASSNNIFSGFTNMTNINAINLDILSIINLAYMFQNCSKLEKINLKYWDTSNITNTIGMFEGCSSLKSINLNGLNTDQLQKTNSMFLNCTSLSEIKFGDFKTNNVINMNSMFKGCTSLKTVDVSSFNTANVTRMDSMFFRCNSLEGTFDLSNWNISNVENFSSMFFECRKINKIIMSGRNEKATSVGAMFQGCWAKEIDISGITCQNTQSVHCMFHNYGMPNIEEPRKIDISSMIFDNITDHDYFIRDGYTSKDIVYVKDQAGQDFVIMQNTRNLFSTENVIIKTNE